MNPSGTVILCVHGIQGSPSQFDWILSALGGHVPVENLLLPGHGGDVRAFRKSGMHAWQACVDAKITQLSARYENILYIGHSMGCLLGIDACIRLKTRVRALMLLACPLALRPSWRYVKNNFCAAASIRLDDPFVAAARSGNSVQAASPLAYLSCLRPYLQLLFKMRSVRKQLAQLTLPVLAIHSQRDEIVSPRSLDYFKPLPRAKTAIAPDSGHFLYSPAARQEILSALGGLLNSDQN